MARNSQAALIALNRFGFGARGGASGDFVNAASDPRGFVKAELRRPNGVLLEVPGLLSTPALGKAVFDYQFEIQQARDAASKSAPAAATETPPQPPPDAQGATAKPVAQQHRHGHGGRRSHRQKPAENANASMAAPAAAPPETMQPAAPKPPPQPLNIIQKTFRAEALARLQRATHRRLRLRRTAGGVLVQSFLHLRQQGRAGADVGRLVRARGDPARMCSGASPTC